jgi:hypothetical protein
MLALQLRSRSPYNVSEPVRQLDLLIWHSITAPAVIHQGLLAVAGLWPEVD